MRNGSPVTAVAIVIVLCTWSSQTRSPDRPLVSVVMDVPDEIRQELPEAYTGVWRKPSVAAVPDRSLPDERRDVMCITSERERRSLTIHSLQILEGRETWRPRDAGSAFVVDGAVYAYVLDQITNVAIGRVVRFRGEGESRSLSLLDPNSLQRALEERGLPMTLTTSQLRVDVKSVTEVLRQGRLRFDVIATVISQSTEPLPPCR